MSDKQDPAAEFGSRLNHHVQSDALAETIYLGLFAVRTNTWTGETEPDWRTRATFAQMAVAYKVGKPLERKEEALVTSEMTVEDMRERAKISPAYKAALVKLLEDLIAGTDDPA